MIEDQKDKDLVRDIRALTEAIHKYPDIADLLCLQKVLRDKSIELYGQSIKTEALGG